MQATLPALTKIQGRVVLALVLREMRASYGKTQIGYLWAILQPVFFVALLAALFTAIGRTPPFGNSMPLFFATGMLPFYMFSRMMRDLPRALTRDESLFEYPLIKQIDSLFARGFLNVITYTVAMILVFSGLMFFLETPPPDRIEIFVLGMSGLAMLGFGMGAINAVVGQIMPSWRMILSLLNRPMIFFSGVLHPVEGLPTIIQEFLAWNPILHGVELARTGYYMGYRCTVLDVGYLFEFGLGVCLIGLLAERALRLRLG